MRSLCATIISVALLAGSAVGLAAQDEGQATTADELLSGFVTEEFEPGVFRVVNDGVRDLRSESEDGGPYDLVAGHDGSVWLFDWPNRSVRLGEEAEYGWGGFSPEHAVEVTSDGTLWRVDTAGSIDSFDGHTWAEHTPAINSDDQWNMSTLKVGPDGTIWALAVEGSLACSDPIRAECRHTVLISLSDDRPPTTTRGWSDIYEGPVAADALAVSPDGEVWLMGVRGTETSGDVQVLLSYDGQEWQVVEVPGGRLYNAWAGQSFDIGPDGAMWAAYGSGRGLARLDESGWTVFTEAEGVRPWGTEGFIPTDHLHAAADGSVWVNAEGTGSSCGGVANFDGSTWTGYLTSLCVHDLDIAPDGAVWVRAGTFERRGGFEYWDSPDLYVITPEAVAGTE